MNTIQVPVRQDFSETVDYIIPQFPIYIRKGLLSAYPAYRAISHWHEDIEFIYLLAGEMDYEINGTIVHLHTKEGIIINSRSFHFGFSKEQKECEFICILIHPSLFAANSYIRETYVRPFTECIDLPYILLNQLDWHHDMAEYLKQVLNLDTAEDEFYLSCQSLVMDIFQLLYKNIKISLQQEPHGSRQALAALRRMVHHIQIHYSEPLTLADIASVGDMSKTSCCNIFNRYMHTTPVNYLLTYRMSQGYHLLLETEMSVTEIAFAVGFHDSSYFTKYFREYYGRSPREMRKTKVTEK